MVEEYWEIYSSLWDLATSTSMNVELARIQDRLFRSSFVIQRKEAAKYSWHHGKYSSI
jgi:hypothetical protein